ncbi:MAG TPA: hypothetical protein VE523_09740 [Solirubrobacterales bacterium]|nr:hypothetical protein [Solirubrobacterales bacterium]
MSTITKMALAVLAGLLVGGGTLAVADNGADDGLETMTVTTTTEEPGDVSGPCDEAEHANDPRCDGTQRPENGAGDDDADVDDISGPCDEAEHANDPRCSGEGGAQVDNSGPGSANSGHGGGHDDDDDDGDREDNSGPGSANSGHDGDDDNSGSGSGSSGSGHSGSGGDDDSSGSGSGGSDDD